MSSLSSCTNSDIANGLVELSKKLVNSPDIDLIVEAYTRLRRPARISDRLEREELIWSVARGWCHDDNSSKVMDCDLAKAIVHEVAKLFDL